MASYPNLIDGTFSDETISQAFALPGRIMKGSLLIDLPAGEFTLPSQRLTSRLSESYDGGATWRFVTGGSLPGGTTNTKSGRFPDTPDIENVTFAPAPNPRPTHLKAELAVVGTVRLTVDAVTQP